MQVEILVEDYKNRPDIEKRLESLGVNHEYNLRVNWEAYRRRKEWQKSKQKTSATNKIT